jgi:hypothetical protein
MPVTLNSRLAKPVTFKVESICTRWPVTRSGTILGLNCTLTEHDPPGGRAGQLLPWVHCAISLLVQLAAVMTAEPPPVLAMARSLRPGDVAVALPSFLMVHVTNPPSVLFGTAPKLKKSMPGSGWTCTKSATAGA